MEDIRIFERDELQSIRERAQELADTPGGVRVWMRAYQDLATAADVLDAMKARYYLSLTDTRPIATARPKIIRTVCIGWTRVDPSAYGGWDGRLDDCELDASRASNKMAKYGFRGPLILTENATIDKCRLSLRVALDGMTKGDMLIVWTSGHGGQQPDSVGEGSDRLGEYICAYDGRVSDNTIHDWLCTVPEGVRVLWICDTCHSSTMHKGTPVRFHPRAIPNTFKGELILLAGCGENKYSLSTGDGGMWSNALLSTGPKDVSPVGWFNAAFKLVPVSEQAPVYTEYGNVSDEFRRGIIVE